MASKVNIEKKQVATELRTLFLQKSEPSLIPIQIDEIDATFYVKERTVEDSFKKQSEDVKETTYRLVLKYLCDFDGNPVFTEEDIEILEKTRGKMFSELSTKMSKILFPEVGTEKEGEKGKGS